MRRPQWSVIIPTFNREDVLLRTIRAYLDQEGDFGGLEIIVVDDGSTDATPQLLENIRRTSPEQLKVIRQGNKGPAAARNQGLRHAQGALILFAGDDVIPCRNLLELHLSTHRSFPFPTIAVLGKITWSPEQNISPLMQWLEAGGWQFHYGGIQDPHNVPPDMFYSSNISLHKELLDKEVFDEAFSAACWEDIDLGLRLQKHGLRIIYNEHAIGYHLHPTDFHRFARRSRRAGYFEAMFHRKHNRTFKLSSPSVVFVRWILGTLLRVITGGALKQKGFLWSLQWHQYKGIYEYQKQSRLQ